MLKLLELKKMIMKRITLLLLIILIIISSCEKNNEIEKEQFDMVYEIFRQPDEEIMAITGYAKTYFPEENITADNSRIKCNCYDKNSEEYLENIDTIKIVPGLKVYIDCERSVEIRIDFKVKDNQIRYRDYNFEVVKILNKSDAYFSFTWPNDSARYEYNEVIYPASPKK
jgi:hypothetical protein